MRFREMFAGSLTVAGLANLGGYAVHGVPKYDIFNYYGTIASTTIAGLASLYYIIKASHSDNFARKEQTNLDKFINQSKL